MSRIEREKPVFKHGEVDTTGMRARLAGPPLRESGFGIRSYLGCILPEDHDKWRKAAHLWVRGIPQQIVREQSPELAQVDQVVGLDLAMRLNGVWAMPLPQDRMGLFYSQEVMKNG